MTSTPPVDLITSTSPATPAALVNFVPPAIPYIATTNITATPPSDTPTGPLTLAVTAFMPIPTSRPQLAADESDFATQLATNLSDDLRLTPSSPVRASWDPVEDESGVFFTTRSSEAEHKAFVERAQRATGQVQGGLKTCPISLTSEMNRHSHRGKPLEIIN